MFGDYENFFDWLIATFIANTAILSIIRLLILVALLLLILKLLVSLLQQIINLFK